LEKVRDYPNEPLRDYIRRFLEIRISIPNINNDEAIFAFIRGLRYHDALRTKLLGKRPESVQDLLMVVKSGQMLTRPTSRSRRMSGELLVLTSQM
jgi:hypothetical protein